MDAEVLDMSLSRSSGTTAARGRRVRSVASGVRRVRISGALRAYLEDVRDAPVDPTAS
jgi:hypothetical protein